MKNTPTRQQLDHMPRLFETDHDRFEEKLIYLHFFIGESHWFMAEYDGNDRFLGFSISNGDYQSGKWGYFSFAELQSVRLGGGDEIDCDTDWILTRADDIDLIKRCPDAFSPRAQPA